MLVRTDELPAQLTAPEPYTLMRRLRLCGVTVGPGAADLLTQPLAAHLAALAAPSFTIPATVDVVLRYAGTGRSPCAFNL